ncbi:class I SAM-dependent methyltransferase, partial [Streptomyces violaceoruber]
MATGPARRRTRPGTRGVAFGPSAGQLAVGLAALGLDVTATDASAAMARRTHQLAEQHGVSLRTLRVSWDELSDRLDGSPPFDVVFCVGNSLAHAEGASARFDALTAMSRLLSRDGHLVLTSRTWELVRACGSRLDVGPRLVRRQGRDGVVVYNWQIEQRWDEEHHLEIAVAQVTADGSVLTRSERLSCWPFRQE